MKISSTTLPPKPSTSAAAPRSAGLTAPIPTSTSAAVVHRGRLSINTAISRQPSSNESRVAVEPLTPPPTAGLPQNTGASVAIGCPGTGVPQIPEKRKVVNPPSSRSRETSVEWEFEIVEPIYYGPLNEIQTAAGQVDPDDKEENWHADTRYPPPTPLPDMTRKQKVTWIASGLPCPDWEGRGDLLVNFFDEIVKAKNYDFLKAIRDPNTLHIKWVALQRMCIKILKKDQNWLRLATKENRKFLTFSVVVKDWIPTDLWKEHTWNPLWAKLDEIMLKWEINWYNETYQARTIRPIALDNLHEDLRKSHPYYPGFVNFIRHELKRPAEAPKRRIQPKKKAKNA